MFKKTLPVAVIIASTLLLGGCSSPSDSKAGSTGTPKASSSSTATSSPETTEEATPETEPSEAPTDETVTPEPEVTLTDADMAACQTFVTGITTLYDYEPASATDFTSIDQFVAATDAAKTTADVSPDLSASLAEVSTTTVVFKDLIIKQEADIESVTEEELTVAGENFSAAIDAMRAYCTF